MTFVTRQCGEDDFDIRRTKVGSSVTYIRVLNDD
jgi:hypothetical protein